MSPQPAAAAREADVLFIYFIVEPSGEQLRQGGLLESGDIRPTFDQVFRLAQARRAYEAALLGHPRGKIVLTIASAPRRTDWNLFWRRQLVDLRQRR